MKYIGVKKRYVWVACNKDFHYRDYQYGVMSSFMSYKKYTKIGRMAICANIKSLKAKLDVMQA